MAMTHNLETLKKKVGETSVSRLLLWRVKHNVDHKVSGTAKYASVA